MNSTTAEVLGRHLFAGRGLHERRATEEDRAGALDDDCLIAHRGHIGATGGARAHHRGDLRDAGLRHARLVIEDAAEVIAVGKDVGLHRQEGATRVDQVYARQAVLERDLLRSQMLLDRQRVVRAALDRRVVRDDHTGAPLNDTDPGDDAGRRHDAVVLVPGGERAEFEEGAIGVDKAVDAFACQQLAAGCMLRTSSFGATGDNGRAALRQERNQLGHLGRPSTKLIAVAIDVSRKDRHRRFSGSLRLSGTGWRHERNG